jgi:hypothetical protein
MYRSGDRAYLKLATEIEEVTGHGLVAVSAGSTSIQAGGYGAAAFGIKRGCLAGHDFALAYGIMQDRHDTAVAMTRGAPIKLMEKALPSDFRTQGTLVYASVPPGPIDLVVSAPGGGIVANEVYAAPGSNQCT